MPKVGDLRCHPVVQLDRGRRHLPINWSVQFGDNDRSMSDVVADLIRLGLRTGRQAGHSRRGMPVVSVGHAVTPEDVRSLYDDA